MKLFKNKGFFAVDEKIYKEENTDAAKPKHLVKNVYGGVKIPWGKYMLGNLIGCIAYACTAMQANSLSDIASGQISDSSVIGSYALFAIGAALCTFLSVPAVLATVEISSRVRDKLWKKIMKLPVDYFDSESPNRIISRVTLDTENAASPFTLFSLVIVFMTLVIVIVTSSSCNMTMVKIMLWGLVAVITVMSFAAIVVVYAGFISANRLSMFTSFLAERLASMKLIKASKAEDREIEKGLYFINLRYQAGMMTVIANALIYFGMLLSYIFIYIACFWAGSRMVRQGIITSGAEINSAYIFGTYVGQAFLVIAQIPTLLGSAVGGSRAFASIFDKDEEDTAKGQKLEDGAQDITLKDVHFSYDGKREVLQGVSCVIPKGKVTAVVGSNGSGKSTMIKLVDRLYTNVKGEICYGEQPADEVSLASWRDKFAIVSQNASLFAGSICDNICYGIRREVSDEELERIVRMANLEDVVAKHEDGLNFDIGIGGSRLSGGEQQRISIARAMMKNPEYLILDEATANLDSLTEQKINQGIEELMKGRTVIMIAHNYTAVEKADHVIVLNNGKLEGSGDHETLMQSCDFYQRLAASDYEV